MPLNTEQWHSAIRQAYAQFRASNDRAMHLAADRLLRHYPFLEPDRSPPPIRSDNGLVKRLSSTLDGLVKRLSSTLERQSTEVAKMNPLEQRAAQAVAMHGLAVYHLQNLSLTPTSFRFIPPGALVAFALCDDSPIDDWQLCTLFQMDTTWYIAFKGFKRVYTQVVGDTSEVNAATVKPLLQALWSRVRAEEGSLRSQ